MATRNALAQLAFTAEEVRLTAEVAAAVLHLGQLEFRRLRGSIGEGDKYSESCRIADDGPLLLAAGLLGVDAEAMQRHRLPLDEHQRRRRRLDRGDPAVRRQGRLVT